MKQGEYMLLTRENIKAGMTASVGINKKQCEILGIEYDRGFRLKKGWLQRLIHTEISEEKYKAFLNAGKSGKFFKAEKKGENFTVFIPKKEGLRLHHAILKILHGDQSLSDLHTWILEFVLERLDQVVCEKGVKL